VARLIDSDVIIEVERRGQADIDLPTIAAGEPIAISTVTAAEILAGSEIRRLSRGGHRISADVETMFRHVRILPFDMDAARIYGQIFARLRATGQSIGTSDLMIAATALANDHDMVTLNVREFSRVPGLHMIAPEW
jgi:tRNA(fMet)-specific endonuclease VapC